MGAESTEPFARVNLQPSAGCWVVRATGEFSYQFGRTFSDLELCYHADQASVFVLEQAVAIREVLQRIFPGAVLEPITFEEWISLSR